jgi:uncharacterized protein (TIGR02246 family)
MKLRLLAILTVVICGCTQPPGEAEVQEFVRQYVAAQNTTDASKMMSFVAKDAGTSSVSGGKIYRGWESIRAATDEDAARSARTKITVGTIDVTPLGSDAALAVATISFSGVQQLGRVYTVDLPGAMTIVVRRTPDGLKFVHEHYSIRLP